MTSSNPEEGRSPLGKEEYTMSVQQVAKYRLSISPEKAIDADLMNIPLDMLKLDPRNVRFRHVERMLTDKEMEDHIWGELDTRELYNAIKWSQGLSEPPVVLAEADYYLTKEGNRRVVCLRKLKDAIIGGKLPELPRDKIDPVQCVVLPKDVKESDIAIYLARAHVMGKKEWRKLNQAAHVYELLNVHRFTWDDIKSAIGMSKKEIGTTNVAYETTLKYRDKYPEDEEWLRHFSYFYEAFKKEKDRETGFNLKEWTENNLDLFMEWIRNDQIKRGMEVRELPKIINDQEAYNVLLNGGTVEDALDKYSGKDPTAGSPTFKLFGKTLKVIHTFPRNELIDTLKNKAKLQMLKKLHSELGDLIKDVERAAAS